MFKFLKNNKTSTISTGFKSLKEMIEYFEEKKIKFNFKIFENGEFEISSKKATIAKKEESEEKEC